jgi:hypothetical protein
MCLQYDGKFLIEKTSTLNFAYLNFEGYLCPHPRAKDLAVQIEFSTYSNTRGFTPDANSLSEEFFEKVKLSQRP